MADTTYILEKPDALQSYRDMRHLGRLNANGQFVAIHELQNLEQAA